MSEQLENEYRALLEKTGNSQLYQPSSAHIEEIVREMVSQKVKEGEPSFHITPETIDFLKSALGKPGMHAVLASIDEEVRSAIDGTGLSLPMPVFTGEFPTGDNNAMAMKTPNGALILINTGLLMCIYQVLKIFMLNTGVKILDDDSQQEVVDVESSINQAQATSYLADICLAYLFRRSSTFAERLPVLAGSKAIIHGQLVKWSEVFVLAHEYGHVLAGHLDHPRPKNYSVPQADFDITVVEKSWQDEIEADFRAMILLVPPSLRTVTDQIAAQELMLRITGIVGFFMIDHMLTSVALLLGGDHPDRIIISDHPPAISRCQLLLEQLKKGGGERVMGLAFGLMDWFEQQRVELLTFVSAELSRQRDASAV